VWRLLTKHTNTMTSMKKYRLCIACIDWSNLTSDWRFRMTWPKHHQIKAILAFSIEILSSVSPSNHFSVEFLDNAYDWLYDSLYQAWIKNWSGMSTITAVKTWVRSLLFVILLDAYHVVDLLLSGIVNQKWECQIYDNSEILDNERQQWSRKTGLATSQCWI
jgi:hypothetical protein